MKFSFEIISSAKEEIIDITSQVKEFVAQSKIKTGVCVVYVPHATAAIIINENYDPNICTDLLNCLGSLIPAGKWLHDKIDGNASAHLKSSILGPSETVVIENGELLLGIWQNLMLCDFDGPRKRKVLVKIVEG